MKPRSDIVSILLVDDRAENLLALEVILKRSDYFLVQAHSGPEALLRSRDTSFAVILADVMMPAMSGFEFATLLRQEQRNRETPIIFLTAMAEDLASVHQGYAAGAVDYLTKPLDSTLVRAKVAVFADLYRKNKLVERQAELLRASEERQRLVLDRALEAFISIDAEGHVTAWNCQAELTFGWKRQEVIGRLLTENIIPGRFRNAHQRGLQHFLETGDGPVLNRRFEIVACCKNGREIPVEMTISPLKIPGGYVFNAFLHDISEFKRIEKMRETQLELTRLLAEGGSIEDVMPQLLRTICESIGWSLGEFWRTDDEGKELRCESIWYEHATNLADFADLSRARPLARGEGLPGRVWARGEPVWINDVLADDNFPRMKAAKTIGLRAGLAFPVRGGGNQMAGVIEFFSQEVREPDATLLAVMVDVGNRIGLFIRRREAESELQRLNRELEQRVEQRTHDLFLANTRLEGEIAERQRLYEEAQRINRLKDEFLATVSHELRTPLNAILGWSDLIRKQEIAADEFHQAIETIHRNAKSQNELIGDLLDVSRIISGKLELSMTPVRLMTVVDEALESMRLATKAKDLVVEVSLESTVGTVLGDPGRLRQVVWNLLSNAVKFTPRGGRIDVKISREGSFIAISVSDTGQGIDPAFLPHVFERFRQEDGSTTRRNTGLGLGLAIVRHIVELHGGKVEAQSQGKGSGTKFIIRLPVIALQDSRASMASARAPVSGRDKASATDHDSGAMQQKVLRGTRILAIDDLADSRLMIKTVLQRAGAEVRTADSGKAGLAALSEAKPDVILCDIGMPEMDGYEFMQRLLERGRDEGSKVPAVALTAYAQESDKAAALKAGFAAHLTKPVDAASLVNLVAQLQGRE